MKPYLLLFATLASILMLVLPVHAQSDDQYKNIYSGRTFNNPMSATMDTFIHQRMQRSMIYRSVLRKKGWYSEAEIDRILQKSDEEILAYMKNRKAVTDSSSPEKPAPASRFQRNATRLLIIPAAEALGKTEEEVSNYRTIFAEVMKAYEGEADRLGFTNDIAGTMAFFTELNYSLYHPGQKEISDAGTRALVRQFQSSLDTETLRKASDEEKQKLYEYYLILSGYTLAVTASSQGKADQKMKDALVKMGGEGLRAIFKIDPSRITLTDKGVEISPEK